MCYTFCHKSQGEFQNKRNLESTCHSQEFSTEMLWKRCLYGAGATGLKTLYFLTLVATFCLTLGITLYGGVLLFLQRPVVEGVVSGRTVSHYVAELLDLRRGMSWTGQIMCGRRCTLSPNRDGFTATPVRTRVINHCFMKLVGGRS